MAAGLGDEILGDEARPIAPGSGLDVLRHVTFRRVFIGAFLSNIGMWMQNVVLGALAYDLTHSATFVGQVIFAQLGPFLFLAPIGGLMADKLDRRRLLIVVALTQIALSLALAAIVVPDDPNRTAILAVVFGIGVGQAIFGPTFSAVMPLLVDREDLPGAVSLNSAQMNASRLIGPMIGAFVSSEAGAPAVFILNAASRFFVIGALMSVTLPDPTDHVTRGLRALGEGLRIAWTNRIVGRCLATISLFSLISLVFIGQLPVLADRNFDIDPSGRAYGFLYACFALGGTLGALSIGSVLGHLSKARLTRVFLGGYAGSLAVFALVRGPTLAYPMATVVGFAYIALVTSLMTLLQEQSDDEVRGRVMALWMVGWGGMVPLGNLIAGPIIDATSITAVVLVGAAFAVVLAAKVRLDVAPERYAPRLPADLATAPCPGR